ncbi:4404_t:CDS:1 [Cetraspora pellucida]|uniref:4404_t:CDS:1 n=1 Tax=Cetraspora pellucida TaxID=1433469 RepID=A0A9N9DXV6_9GLOM|nr:4404_t:CDS:1 [Cetraspora pellucida]
MSRHHPHPYRNYVCREGHGWHGNHGDYRSHGGYGSHRGYGSHGGSRNYVYPLGPRRETIVNDRDNNLTKLFRIFASIPRWNGYPYLFIMVCNADYQPDNKDSKVVDELEEIRMSIDKINQYSGASPQMFKLIKETLDDYQNLRVNHNQKQMEQLVEKVGFELRPHSVKDHTKFLEQLRNLTVEQRSVLREICINRLRSFSEFAEYIISYSKDNRVQQFSEELETARNISIEQRYDESRQSSRQIENSCSQISNISNETAKLLEENKRLKLEAARHQAALGNVVNFKWRDDDPNNSMQLVKDIEKLQRDLQSFTRVKGTNIQINQVAVSELFNRYKCSTKFDDKAMKVVLSAVLQRFILEHINELSDDFSRRIDNTSFLTDDQLEAGIASRAQALFPLISRFSTFNPGDDEHTRVLPIKLRQHIYAALSNRGFDNQNHQLVQQILESLIKKMDQYRTIESKDKSKLASKATSIIKQVLKIFCFRLETQEPTPKVEFYNVGDPIDVEVMDGSWQGDDAKDLEVEICSFPAILLIDSEKRILTKAQVMTRPKV